MPLLETKIVIPPPKSGLVPRPRLIERLDNGLSPGHRLILVSAPAGFGKTTLLSAWLGRIDAPAVWLSLDDNDNDPARFLRYLYAAVAQAAPDLAALATSGVATTPAAGLVPLINEPPASPHLWCWYSMIII